MNVCACKCLEGTSREMINDSGVTISINVAKSNDLTFYCVIDIYVNDYLLIWCFDHFFLLLPSAAAALSAASTLNLTASGGLGIALSRTMLSDLMI
jgi:hypothetical protein